MGSVLRVSGAVILLALFAGCSGGGTALDPIAGLQPEAPIPSSDVLGLISPTDALSFVPERTSSAAILQRNGNQYEPGLKQHIIDEGTSAYFDPAWEIPNLTFDSLAYAIYSFNLQGFQGSQDLKIEWGEAPDDYSNVWIGLSEWGNSKWDWNVGSSTGILDLSSKNLVNFTKPGTGEMFVAVVMLGETPALLDSITIGDSGRGDWWMFGRDPQHSRNSPYVGAQTGNLQWKSPTAGLGGLVYGGSLVAPDGTVYVTATSNLHAFSPDGTHLWASQSFHVTTEPILADDGTVYYGSINNLIGINPDGSTRLARNMGGEVVDPANGPNGTLYLGSRESAASF